MDKNTKKKKSKSDYNFTPLARQDYVDKSSKDLAEKHQSDRFR